MSKREIIVGARGSALSLQQARGVLERLRRERPEYRFSFREVITRGDRIKREFSPFEIGVFVKELEEALLAGKVDIAVHSLKDLPCVLSSGLVLAAVSERLCPNDVFLSRDGLPFSRMPAKAVIGTSSARRRSQLLNLRKDICLTGMRGNIDTRLRKLREGRVDAIVCAFCALQRLNKTEISTELLGDKDFLPAPGQAALGLEARADDREALDLAKVLHHELTAECVSVERDFLKALGGGCHLPLGVLAGKEGDLLRARGYVGTLDGSRAIKVEAEVLPEKSSFLGRKLADLAIAEGAMEILKDIK